MESACFSPSRQVQTAILRLIWADLLDTCQYKINRYPGVFVAHHYQPFAPHPGNPVFENLPGATASNKPQASWNNDHTRSRLYLQHSQSRYPSDWRNRLLPPNRNNPAFADQGPSRGAMTVPTHGDTSAKSHPAQGSLPYPLQRHHHPDRPQPSATEPPKTSGLEASRLSGYACLDCGVSFRLPGSYTTHLNATGHRGNEPTPFPCKYPGCTSRYMIDPSLRNHCKKKHGLRVKMKAPDGLGPPYE